MMLEIREEPEKGKKPGAAGYIQEIFVSVQGEGPLVGWRHLFLRLAGCRRSCIYCDTPRLFNPPFFRYEEPPASGNFLQAANPLFPVELLTVLSRYPLATCQALALTGGEPLEQAGFLKEFLPLWRKETGLPVYLETNGLEAEKLALVLSLVDYIAMDIKLPSTCGAGPYWNEHRQFLRLASSKAGNKKVFVKLVVNDLTEESEVTTAVRLVEEEARGTEIIFQPQTLPEGALSISPGRIHLLMEAALSLTPRVRVIPQIHRVLRLL